MRAEHLCASETSFSEPHHSHGEKAEQSTRDNFNIPGIDQKIGIANSGGLEPFTKFLGEVYALIDERSALIKSLLAKEDIHNFTIQVHTLKTTCRLLGAMALSDNFYTLEKLGRAKNLEKIQEYAPHVLEAFTSLKPYLAPYAVKEVEPVKTYAKEEVAAILADLKQAMLDFDLNHAEECTAKLSAYKFTEDLRPIVQQLRKYVANLDFDEADALAEKLLRSLA